MRNPQKALQKYGCPLNGKTVLVTGANSGIGYAAAVHFLMLGADLLLVCRSAERGQRAAEQLQAQFPGSRIVLLLADLASNASIKALAQNIAERGEKIDIFLSCAGVYYPSITTTEDGLPMTVGVNYVGTVRLTEALLPAMHESTHIVLTTSLTDRFGRVCRAPKPGAREGFRAYAESKLLLSAYICKKARLRGEKEPIFTVAHPGITATSLLDPAKTSHHPLFSKLGHAFLYLFTHSKEKAALTAVYAACHGQNGDCIGPRGLFGISGYPRRTQFCRNVRRQAARGSDPYIADAKS